MIHISSLQLELAACFFARFVDITGASNAGGSATGPLLFHKLPICFKQLRALSSINPSLLGATFRIKLQKALFSGTILSFTREDALLTASEGKELFQNQALFTGRQDNAGSLLLSFEICCPAPCSYDLIS